MGPYSQHPPSKRGERVVRYGMAIKNSIKEASMSKLQPGDAFNTKMQLTNPNPVDGNKTWLRHKADGESGLIDLMILEGVYSIGEMIEKLVANNTLTPKNSAQWEKRIRDHILHLSTTKGDSRNRASGQNGHNINIKTTAKGKIAFDL